VVQNHYADYYLKLEVHKLMEQQSTAITMLTIIYQKSELHIVAALSLICESSKFESHNVAAQS
jgi:hypothetical protein